jgi:fructose-1,6-bisphosphatase/inositol monophosphatase family enzyme
VNTRLPRNPDYFLTHLRDLALELRAATDRSIRTSSSDELSTATGDRGGDTIFRLDLHAEEVLLDYCARWGGETPLLLVAEGLHDGRQQFTSGSASPAFTLIVDPIDGTRGLMYGKRSAWALLAVAPPPTNGSQPRMDQIEVALQAELPTARAALADLLWAVRGQGVQAETQDLRGGSSTTYVPRPSRADTLAGGFATISKFFPGAKAAAAALEEKLFLELLGPPQTESPQVFDDEYISSGGQLYELMVGHDRFIADLRPLLHPSNEPIARLCCHPYDLCTELIAREAGVIVTDEEGRPLSAPLDTSTSVAWIGYANDRLRREIEPVLHRLIRERTG